MEKRFNGEKKKQLKLVTNSKTVLSLLRFSTGQGQNDHCLTNAAVFLLVLAAGGQVAAMMPQHSQNDLLDYQR